MAKKGRNWFNFKRKKEDLGATQSQELAEQGEGRLSPLITLGGIGAILLLAIVIPIVITSFRIVRMSPVDPTKTLVTISSGKETVKLNFNQIEAETNDDLSRIRQQERALTSAVIRYLYDKERDNIQDKASLLREVERSLQLDQPLPTITIPPTILSIETSVKADLDDKKKEFERNFGIDNWPLEFAKELQKDEYGNALDEQQAINFKIDQRLRQTAFLASELELNRDFSSLFQGAIRLRNDVIYHSNNRDRVAFKAGDSIKLEFLQDAIRPSNSKGKEPSNLILLLSKGGRLEGRNKLADFIDFLAKRQQLFWYIRLPIRLKRDLAGLNFSSTTRELTDLLTLIPQAVDLSLKEPIFKGITPLISLAANLSKTTDIGHDLKLKGSHRLTRDELVDLVVDRLKGEKADTNSSKSLQETNSKSKDQPQTLRDRINSKTLSFDSASVVELLTNLPEASPLLLTRLFKIRQLQADIFKEIASDLYKEFKIDIPTKDSYTLVELNQVNDRIKDHLLNLGEGRIEAGLNRVLKARFAAKVDGRLKLATSLKFASSYILPREDSLILFRPLDLEEARGILVKQLEQGEGQTKGETLDLNTLFESYSKDLAGKDAEKIIVKTLEESDFKAGLKDLKVADKPITNEDLKAVNNLLVSRLKQQESLQLTALVDNLTKVFLSAEAAASNSDLRLDLNGLSLTNLTNNLNKGKKQEIISLFSNELRSLLLERQRPATKQQAISSSKQAIKEANR